MTAPGHWFDTVARSRHTGHMTNTAHSFPALTGDVVTEAHARKCREQGHATHTVNGVETGRCPRCGELTGQAANFNDVDDAETFERILDLEDTARATEAVSGCQLGAGVPDFRKAQVHASLNADKARLFEAISALTPDQARRFGEYRRTR